MELKELQAHWNALGKTDPLWAILSDPEKKGGHWDIEQFLQTGDEEISRVMQYVDSLEINLRKDKALDFGCGVGRLTQALCRYFKCCVGVDIAQSMIEQANYFNAYQDRCQYYLNETNDLSIFKDNSIDFIYSNLVLQHMEPAYSKNYIKEFIRIVSPGGLVLFQLPSDIIPLGTNIDTKPNQTSNAQPLPTQAFRAYIDLQFIPKEMESGSQILLHAKVKNISDFTWPVSGNLDGKYQLKSSTRWFDEAGTAISADDIKTILPNDLKPSEEIELPLLISTPKLEGTFVLELDMLQEGVAWFKDKGSTPRTFTINLKRTKHGETSLDIQATTPIIQMYGVTRRTVEQIIEEAGGKCIEIQKNNLAGEHWTSFQYTVTK
jgi:ubiquinone/menaquinone biosynthesis C-methylase UbiE